MDPRKWLEAKLKDTKLTPEQQAAALAAFDDDNVVKGFKQDFVDVPTFKAQLEERERPLRAENDKLTQFNTQWQQKYYEDVLSLGGVEQLKAAGFDTTNLRDAGGGRVRDIESGEVFTRDDVTKTVRDAISEFATKVLEPMRAGLVQFTSFAVQKAPQYEKEYGKPFDVEKFRNFAAENSKRFATYDDAFTAFTTEDREAKLKSDRETWEKDTTARIERDILSKYKIPEVIPGGGNVAPFHGGAHATAENRADADRPYSYSIPSKDAVSMAPVDKGGNVELKTRLAQKYAGADFDFSGVMQKAG